MTRLLKPWKKFPTTRTLFLSGEVPGRCLRFLISAKKRLRPWGSLVVNTVTLENTAEALEWFKGSGLHWDFIQMQVSRRKAILDLQRLEALNPVFIFWGSKAE